MSAPLFTTDCPSCGAPVHVHSATAVTLVCDYCHSLLLRDDQGLSDSGRDSALLEDFSPLQIGSGGKLGTLPFTIIGRLQAQYDAGMWNEWYVLFADGSTGWLSEAGDLYVFLRPAESVENVPAFAAIQAGKSALAYNNKRFIAADVREITLTRAAAQGELPFVVPEKMVNRVADFRCENHFLTVDYGDDPPEIFYGHGVSLDGLHLQNVRDEAQIIASAGKLKGTRSAQNCPNCGSPVEWVSGATATLICPSCTSTLDTSGEQAQLVEAGKHRRFQEDQLTLPLGAQGEINGKTYTVIGAVRKDELDIDEARQALRSGSDEAFSIEGGWTEYLLYHPGQGFLWLVETDEYEWSMAETLNEWPRLNKRGGPQGMPKLYEYGSRVTYAAGAFYWHIRHGDILIHRDYGREEQKISAEQSMHELSWSKNHAVSAAQLKEWFGIDVGPVWQNAEGNRTLSYLMIAVFLLLNIPAWLKMDGNTLIVSLAVSFIAIKALHSLGKAKHGATARRDNSEEEDDS